MGISLVAPTFKWESAVKMDTLSATQREALGWVLFRGTHDRIGAFRYDAARDIWFDWNGVSRSFIPLNFRLIERD